MRTIAIPFLVLAGVLSVASPAAAGGGRDAILAELAAAARAEDPAFTGFSAQRGAAFFAARHASGKPETPSCTTCHGPSPRAGGRTRAGKAIAPMAVSVSPERYSDPAKTAKWFRRNCRSVLGRACTAREKGDFITFMSTQ